MQTKVFAIIPAAGSSTRMQSAGSKVLLQIAGEPVLVHSLRQILDGAKPEKAVIAVRESDLPETSHIISTLSADRVSATVGGSTRQESVKLALAELTRIARPAPDDLILIHDAARCFVSTALVRRCVDAAARDGAVTAAIRAVDTLVRDRDGVIAEQIDRSSVWAVQTPQVFRYALLFKAHEEASPGATDDASLVSRFSPVHIVEGERENLKLTVPADIQFANRFQAGNR